MRELRVPLHIRVLADKGEAVDELLPFSIRRSRLWTLVSMRARPLYRWLGFFEAGEGGCMEFLWCISQLLHSDVPVEAKLADLKEDDREDINLLLQSRGTRDNDEDRGGIAGYRDLLLGSVIETRRNGSARDIKVL